MKITLIFPGITEIGFRSYGESPDSSWQSHGLSIISACLKKAHHEVALIDLRKLSGWEEYQQILVGLNPDVVGITMMSCDFNPAVRCAELAHEVLPGVKVIVGGPHPSIMPDEVASCKDFDYIVKGEGEITFTEILNSISEGDLLPRIIQGKSPDLDALPFSDRELFGPYEVSIPISDFQTPFMTFIAGRGCRYNCSFCQPAERKIFGTRVRRRSPKNFIEEILDCKKRYNFRSYLIHDDCLLEDIKWVEEFCRLMEENNLVIPFACQGRADLICKNPELIKRMENIGLRAVIVGFESGNDRILKFIRKGVTVKQNIGAGRVLKDLGLKIWANYMIGLPTETVDEMLDTIRMIKKIQPDLYSPSIYTPHPGSDMFDYCVEHGLMLSLSHDSYRRNITEVKIKGQEWSVIEWAVSESTDPHPDVNFFREDYFSHWGELLNLATRDDWPDIESSCSEKFQLHDPQTQNLEIGTDNIWTSTSTDPQFIWKFNPELNPKHWSYIVVDLEINCSTKAQFIWYTGNILRFGKNRSPKFQATRHFRVKFGRNKYVFDLKKLKTFRKSLGHDLSWDDYPVQELRFDPAESEGAKIVLHDIFLLGN